jgi:hypothetical protein
MESAVTIYPKKTPKFECVYCQYITGNKKDYGKHILTNKHMALTLANASGDNCIKNTKKYICNICNKNYESRNGLWKHKKICKTQDIVVDKETNNKLTLDNEPNDKALIMMLIKENAQLIKDNSEFKNMVMEQQNMMMEVIKNGTHNTTNTHTNSHNKSFNLQFFLNETCKDAMNIMDFVESIQLQLSDLEKVGEIGFVEGISNIIVKNLKALDVTQRPVHCTDKKREVLYVKDEDKWEKQDEENVKLRKVIKKVTDKNMRLIPKYREKYPDCNKSISRYSDQYNKIIVESMGGSGDNDDEKATKIIKNISKQVLVEKESEGIVSIH